MADTKIFSFPENGNNGNMPAWALPLYGGNGGFGFGGNGLLGGILGFFLGAMMNGGWNGGGLFGGGGNNTALISQANDMLMQAINSKGDLQTQALANLATTINADFGLVQNTFNAINAQLCNISGQIGTSALQTQNAIQATGANLQSSLCQGFAGVQSTLAQNAAADALAICQQTNALQNQGNANTQALLNKIDAVEDSRKDREITALTAKVAQLESQSYAASIAQQAVAPVLNQLAAISNEVEAIKRCQPSTVTLPNNSMTAVPTIWANAVADNIVDKISTALNPTTTTTTTTNP